MVWSEVQGNSLEYIQRSHTTTVSKMFQQSYNQFFLKQDIQVYEIGGHSMHKL